MNTIEAFVEELTRRAERRKPEPMTADPDLAAGEAALAFVNRAGARLVAGCPTCYPGAPAGADYLVLVPQVNLTVEFRAALAVLRIPYPVVPRIVPLGLLPARCQHEEIR